MSFIFGSAPQAPDPTATANQQQKYNIEAATKQNATNSYGQSTPFGSISYVPDPTQPSGYRVVTNTNSTGQTLLNTADTLADNTSGMYSQPFNGENQAVTDKLNQWTGNYLQPIFNQQDSNLEAQLRSQGLMPGTEAYNNAKNLLARNQGDVTNQYLGQNQQQAFNQALQEYQLPQETIAALRQNAMPGGFQSTPTAQIQPADYAGLVEQNYQQQMQNYQNNVSNIGKLIGSGVSLAAAPFTGGTSLLATGASMFGGGGGPITYGGPSGPTAFYGNNTSGGWG